MIAWLAANWLSLIVGAVVLALAALCLRNILPGKNGKPPACAGCGGCGGSCSGCASCGGCPGKK